MTDQTGALVIGGDYRGLSIVRSLGRRNIPVWVLTSDGDVLASTSRYCGRSLPWPSGDPRTQVEYLLDLATRYKLEGWAVFPTGDEAAAFLARNHTQLKDRFRLTTPPWEVLRWAYNKRLTYCLAAQAGVDYPQTLYPASREELAEINFAFPMILKPIIKKDVNRFTVDKAWRVDNSASLLARYDEACKFVTPDLVMLQELIPGGGEAQFSYVALCADGRPLASMTARRTRQYPTDFGHSSSFVETVDQPEIEKPAQRLLAAMRYTGVVEMEFKYDGRNGCFKLLDVNARLWTWHTLCHRAGVDFPYLLWRLVRGEPITELRGRPGVRWVRMATDVLSALSQVYQGKLSPRAYARSLRPPIEYALFAYDDPLPGLLNLPLSAWRRFAAFKGSRCRATPAAPLAID